MKNARKKAKKPFGLELFVEIPLAELPTINGGRHRHHHHHPKHPAPPTPAPPTRGGGGGGVHTMAISIPTPTAPKGDAF